MQVIPVQTAEHLAAARKLFCEYAQWLGVDLYCQNFEEELKTLPGKYAPPTGALLLAIAEQAVLGCVAVRDLGVGACEMKRLYVRREHQGRGSGRALAEAIIREARRLGYQVMRLDTLARLTSAMRLYEKLGFKQIPAYYANPLAGVVYWELDLKV